MAAHQYIERGWSPIPLPYRSKNPGFDGWQHLRVTPGTVDQHFRDERQNVGVLLGEPSGWLIDVDLDWPETGAVADALLPKTGAVFGRESCKRSHWLYVAPGFATKRYVVRPEVVDALGLGDRKGTVVELRSTGTQTVFPGSVHPDGEPIEWHEFHDPSSADPAVLRTAGARVAAAALLLARGWPLGRALEAVQHDGTPRALALADVLVAPLLRDWLEIAKPAVSVTRPAAVGRRPERSVDLDEAVRAYNATHGRDWGAPGRNSCPMCGHNDCFGRLPQIPERWACWSASHTGPGVPGEGHYNGDALDVDSHGEGVDRVALLRRDGYLTPRRQDATAAASPPAGSPPPPPDTRPTYQYEQGRGHEAVAFAIDRLADHALVYQRGRRLVTVAAASDDASLEIKRDVGAPVIAEVSTKRVWELLSETIAWQRYDGRKKRPTNCDPPDSVVTAVATRGDYPPVRWLRGLTSTPILRSDGSVCLEPGYDEVSGLFYAPVGDVPELVDDPGREEAEAAVAVLLDVFADFPFASPKDRSAVLAMVLSVVGQAAYKGPTPLHWIDANSPGAGKSLLVDTVARIATGKAAARSPYVEDDDELRKRITSHAMAGDTFVMIDNVPTGTRYGWPSLDAALTGDVWEDRILGRSENVRIPFRALFVVTGNNLSVKHDAARRSLRVRLETQDENPERRTGFRHAPLIPWVDANRGKLLGAALTVLRAYLLAGAPTSGKPPLGSFEGWSRTIRDALVWVGQADPAECSVALDPDLDTDAAAHRNLLATWWGLMARGLVARGLTAQEIAAGLDRQEWADLRDALVEVCPPKAGAKVPGAREIGTRFKALSGRWRSAAGQVLCLTKVGQAQRAAKWSVVSKTGESVSESECVSAPLFQSVTDTLTRRGENRLTLTHSLTLDEREPGEEG